MTTWGAGAIPLNMQAKLERDEDLTFVIWMTQIGYAKALKGAWINHDWKFTSNKMIQRKEIGLLMQYNELEMIHGR
jgi:hypothetical protein